MTKTYTMKLGEARCYDSGDDIKGRQLRNDLMSHVRGIFQCDTAGNVDFVEIVHPDGFVAWTYDRSDFRGSFGVL